MKNWLKIILITFIFLGLLGYAYPIKAESVVISGISVYDIENGKGKIKWTTNVPTKGILYYGDDPQNLNRFFTYNIYDRYHTANINGLDTDKTYYYKILAHDQDQNGSETFLLNFSTRNMPDTISPRFIKREVVQATGDAIALYWKTNEKATATIYYGFDRDELDKRVGVGGLLEEHEFVVRNLEYNAKYFMKIVASDKHGNLKGSDIFIVHTPDRTDVNDYRIYDVEPTNYDPDLVFADTVTIKFKTNFASRSYMVYGEYPGRYHTRVDINKTRRSQNHQITLMNLKSNTTYYYKIVTYDNIYGRTLQGDEMSFLTLPEQTQMVLGTKIISKDIDSDADGLSDSYEMDLGTNPNHYDSDGDGYDDGTEVANGYDPLGPGKLGTFAYGKARIANEVEQARARELKVALEKELGRPLNISIDHWYTVVNSYIYGEYPVHAIAQALKYGGKTVHPSIGWQAWKNTADYQNYINK